MPTNNGNIDARLDRLTQRHEALTQTVEIIAAQMQETDKHIRRLAERHEALAGHVQILTTNQERLQERVAQLTDLMLTLTSIVRRHEDRLDNLDGGEGDS